NYLEDTGRALKTLKEFSYRPFITVASDGAIIVDIGCGTGIDVIKMSQVFGTGVKVVGVDHDPELLNKAKSASVAVKNVDFILSEAYFLPFENESVSGVRAERLIQHLDKSERAIQEVYRILKKDHPF